MILLAHFIVNSRSYFKQVTAETKLHNEYKTSQGSSEQALKQKCFTGYYNDTHFLKGWDIKSSKQQLIKEKAKAKPIATFKGMTRCMHFIEEGLKKKRSSQQSWENRTGDNATEHFLTFRGPQGPSGHTAPMIPGYFRETAWFVTCGKWRAWNTNFLTALAVPFIQFLQHHQSTKHDLRVESKPNSLRS